MRPSPDSTVRPRPWKGQLGRRRPQFPASRHGRVDAVDSAASSHSAPDGPPPMSTELPTQLDFSGPIAAPRGPTTMDLVTNFTAQYRHFFP
jgi:hypothetical protein